MKQKFHLVHEKKIRVKQKFHLVHEKRDQGGAKPSKYLSDPVLLTAVFFETGAMSTPTKSRNPTNCG